jgi:hypothetical protein
MNESKKKTYVPPELVKIGSVKDLTLGNIGSYQDPGSAGSYEGEMG